MGKHIVYCVCFLAFALLVKAVKTETPKSAQNTVPHPVPSARGGNGARNQTLDTVKNENTSSKSPSVTEPPSLTTTTINTEGSTIITTTTTKIGDTTTVEQSDDSITEDSTTTTDKSTEGETINNGNNGTENTSKLTTQTEPATTTPPIIATKPKTSKAFTPTVPAVTSTAGSPTSSGSGGAAVFITFILTFIIVGAVVAGMIYLKRKRPRCVMKIMRQIGYMRAGGTSLPLTQIDSQEHKLGYVTKSVTKEEFSGYLDRLNEIGEDSNCSQMSEQFKQLAIFSPPPPSSHTNNYSAAALQYNRSKNRYINILPYDSTRVKLTPTSDKDPESDYINASLVKGASGLVEYIACQGPLSDTSEDFWRMVFEKDVCMIAMVTNLEENGKTKCHKYYPELRETMRYERVAVKCIQFAEFPVYTQRTFLVQETNGAILKTVVHLHFREWPDHGCPQSTDLLISFCHSVRNIVSKCEKGLMLVHCSAGVGRTGTLISLDILIQELNEEDKLINIFDTVLQLRYQRISMVQTESQYRYIHECLRDVIKDELAIDSEKKGPSSKAGRTDPIYQNLRNKESSPSQNSAKTELEDIDDIAKMDIAIRISHYVNSEVENELNEVVIPLKDSPSTDTLENQEVEKLIINPDKIAEEQVLCAPKNPVEEQISIPSNNVELNSKENICIPDNHMEENAKELNCTPEKNIEEIKFTPEDNVDQQISTLKENNEITEASQIESAL